jgi:hypothetical protein
MEKKSGDLYLLQDGTYADPKDCEAGKDGVLRSKVNGLAVAKRDDGEPQTLQKTADHNVALQQKAFAGKPAAGEGVQPEKAAEPRDGAEAIRQSPEEVAAAKDRAEAQARNEDQLRRAAAATGEPSRESKVD